MKIKEFFEKHKKLLYAWVICAILGTYIVSIGLAYDRGFEKGYDYGRINNINEPPSQWFGVNNSFAKIYGWERTGNDSWRFYWEWFSFENMTGTHTIEFAEDGMWTVIPFDRVKHVDDIISIPVIIEE